MNGDGPLLLLPLSEWPLSDRAAWDALFAPGDILDGQGPCVGWAQGSRFKREQSYARWLGFLVGAGLMMKEHRPADRVTKENVVAYVELEQQRCKLVTVHIRLDDLLSIVRVMEPARDWQWLYLIVARVRAGADMGYLKPHPGIAADQIYAWAQTNLASIDGEPGACDVDRALRYRDALMVGLLISTPLRRRTFVALTIGQHLKARSGRYALEFKPDDIKDAKPHQFPVAKSLTDPLRRYLDAYRPVLLQGAVSDKLWISRRGGRLATRASAPISRI